MSPTRLLATSKFKAYVLLEVKQEVVIKKKKKKLNKRNLGLRPCEQIRGRGSTKYQTRYEIVRNMWCIPYSYIAKLLNYNCCRIDKAEITVKGSKEFLNGDHEFLFFVIVSLVFFFSFLY